jgi:hypothetical protein
MIAQGYRTMPPVAVSESSGTTAWIVFGILAFALFCGLAYVHWFRKKQERDGIYSKYKLPGDMRGRRRSD